MIKNTSIIILFNIFLLSGTASAATVQDVESSMDIAPASATKDSAQVDKDAAVKTDPVKSAQGEDVSPAAASATGAPEETIAIQRAKQQSFLHN